MRLALAIALIALLSLGVLAPYLHDGVYQNGDLWNFLGGIVEARNALGEGQFPIRVAPNQLDGERYPVFQFYANLPYTVAGLILGEDGRNPYAAWKWTMLAALMIGGLSLHRLAWRWTRSQPAALAAVAVFLSAPYLMTNLNDRGAVAEAFAICLLPSALLATWTCMVRRGLWRAAVCALAWTAVGLTHNITYLYAATFIGVFVVSFVRPRLRFGRRIGRLALAGVLHAMMLAWYVAPQFALMPDLAIAAGVATPSWSAALVPLDVLLWPICKTPAISTIPRLGLQVGWVVLAGAIAAAVARIVARRRRHAVGGIAKGQLRQGMASRLIALWIIALLMVWSPIDFWPALPKLFYFVQFTYRLLGFVLLFGSLLAAIGMTGMVNNGLRRMGWVVCSLVILGAVATQFAYYPPGLYHPRGAHRWINDRPQLGGLGDYVLRPRTELPPPVGTDLVPSSVFASSRKPGDPPVFRAEIVQPSRIVLPVLWYPRMLEVKANGVEVAYGAGDRHTSVDLPPGRYRIAVRFVGLDWANHLSSVGFLLAIAFIGWRVGARLCGRRRNG